MNSALYCVKWWTRTSNDQIREYFHSVKDMEQGRQFAERKRHQDNTMQLYIIADFPRHYVAERVYTDLELAKIAEA